MPGCILVCKLTQCMLGTPSWLFKLLAWRATDSRAASSAEPGQVGLPPLRRPPPPRTLSLSVREEVAVGAEAPLAALENSRTSCRVGSGWVWEKGHSVVWMEL
jgi:hypothetical protein